MSTAKLTPTLDQSAAWLALLTGHGGAVEIRAFRDGDRPASKVFPPGTDPRKIAVEALTLDKKCKGVYVTLNPLRPDLDRPAKDADVTGRAWILVDVDPKRPRDTNATDGEKRAGRDVADAVRADLRRRGWPDPIVADSGNGLHLIYAVQLPNDDAARALVRGVLKALAKRFDTDAAQVDRTVYNASRISKVYGTTPRKGEATEDRPHRPARVLRAPEKPEPVPVELLEALVAEDRKPEPATHTAAHEGNGHPRAPKATGGNPAGGRRPDVETRAIAYLATCDPAISGQGGHNQTFKTACKVGPGFDLDPETAVRLIVEHYNDKCDPPWSEAEIRHKVDDAYAREPRRGWLRDAERADYRGNGHAGRSPAVNGAGHSGGGGLATPDDDIDSAEILDRWPRPDPTAFHGTAGELADLADPHTEADRVATLTQFLVGFANLIGRGPHFAVGATRHHLNLFVVLIGLTALGRKGTSWDIARWMLEEVDREWTFDRIQGGLVSGEGLIHHVRDPVVKKGEITDEGVEDKRLLILETEMSRALKAANRESNTLSDVVRQAWDSGNLRTLAKNNPLKATGAHISIVGHCTQADLRKHLAETDTANGFGNRFLWACSRRSKELPDGGDLMGVDFEPIRGRLRAAATHAKAVGLMRRDERAAALWRQVYGELSAGRPGLLGAILSRAEAQVMRVACVYALLDRSGVVGVEHLTAALALWDYCERSARLIFGDSLGDSEAEKLMASLREAPGGLSRKEIYTDVFHRRKKSKDIARLLSDLLTQGMIHRRVDRSTGGRPAERWYAGRGDERPIH